LPGTNIIGFDMLNQIGSLLQDTWLGGILGAFGLFLIRRSTKRVDDIEKEIEAEKEARHALELKISEKFATKKDMHNLKNDLIAAIVSNRKVLTDCINNNKRE